MSTGHERRKDNCSMIFFLFYSLLDILNIDGKLIRTARTLKYSERNFNDNDCVKRTRAMK
jgi:hypothetical protein